MNKPDDFDARLKTYLHHGASTPSPAGMEARIAGRSPRQASGWALQVVAAAALLVLAIGLGIAVQRARQSVGVTPPTSPLPSTSPITKPTPYPTPTSTGAAYPLLPPASMRMINASTGWAAGSATDRILRTTDGGSHWVDVTPKAAKAGTWTTFFLDANNAWLASSVQPGSASTDFSVTIYRTVDGGRTWVQAGEVAADRGWPASIDFVDATHGWLFMQLGVAAGSEGVAIFATIDGGTAWTKVSEADTSGNPGHLPFSCHKGPPIFLNSSTGWMPGSCGAGGGPYFYVTHDGAQSWSAVTISLPAGYSGNCMCGISSLRFSDARNGVFVLDLYGTDGLSHSFLYATHDGGNSWQAGPQLPANSYAVYFINATVGWTLDAKKSTILQTSDGGNHWSTVGTIQSYAVPMGMQFVSAAVGWVMGSETAGNTLIKTPDGGRTWTTQLAP